MMYDHLRKWDLLISHFAYVVSHFQRFMTYNGFDQPNSTGKGLNCNALTVAMIYNKASIDLSIHGPISLLVSFF